MGINPLYLLCPIVACLTLLTVGIIERIRSNF